MNSRISSSEKWEASAARRSSVRRPPGFVITVSSARASTAFSASLNGRLEEAQAFAFYQNSSKRLNWGAGLVQEPYFFLSSYTQTPFGSNGLALQSQVLERYVVRQGLLRELPIDGEATVYDSNLTPHHHLYHEDTGEVSDVPAEALQVLGLPALGEGLELAAVDVIVRVRRRGSRPAAA